MQPILDPSIFRRYTHNRYVTLKTQFPSLDRRALLLLIADEFWALDAHSWAALVQPGSTTPPTAVGGLDASNNGEDRDAIRVSAGADDDNDNDDDGDGDAAPPGVVLRTDYTAGSDEAWASFCGTLRDAEREFLADQEGPGSASASTSAPDDDGGDVEMAPAPASHSPVPTGGESVDDDDDDGDDDGDGEGGSEEAEKELALFSLVSDSTRFDGISNLRALRLLFDVSVRTAPTLPSPLGSAHPQHQPKQQRRQDQHRLTCQRGLQETYDARGRTLWIFDARSRIDGCARLVSEAGDVATGDSWRARATHMAELQASLAARALRIDFGGLDRWDYAERQRNMREASVGYAAALSEMN